MAKRKIPVKDKNPLDYITLPQIELDPQVKKGVFIVFILLFGAISFLSLFNLAGVAGEYLDSGLLKLFGYGRYVVPFVIFGIGYLLYSESRGKLKGANYLGIFIFLISFHTLLHLFVAFNMDIDAAKISKTGAELNQWRETVTLGQGGGFLGLFISSAFIKLLGIWASLMIMLSLFVVSLMFMFNTTLSKLIGRDSWFAKIIFFINRILILIFTKFKSDQGEFTKEDFPEPEEEVIEEKDPEEDFGFKEKKVTARGAAGKKLEVPIQEAAIEIKPKAPIVKIDIPLDLLSNKTGKPTSGDINGNIEKIKRTLENFGISVEMGEVAVGPTVTQYTFKPAEGVKLSRITTLNNDLALSLAAHPIRIEAPIPGKSLVGIEVPNQTKAIVGLKEILSDNKFKERKSNLMVALGKDVAGEAWVYDLTKMPHLLVAGATNSGKSVCLNSIIISLLYQNNPDELKFVMVDPKRVELTPYKGIPHLLTPVITEVSKTINALKWCLNEMDKRYDFLEKQNKKNIQDYNAKLKPGAEKMPYIVFIIDELADLMVTAARDVEPSIIRLTQMSRAVGIHLILATQRPSVDVITGVIKANMPARIAFSVASGIDSRTILDSLGAEKLLGRGDMLFTTAEIARPKRIQGAFLGDDEIRRVTGYIKERSGEPSYIEGVTERQKVSGIGGVGLDGNMGDEDDLLGEAKEIIINSGKASASYLQRRLSIGYARAAKLLDLLEEAGVIGPSNGAKPRDILITREQYENMISGGGISGMPLHNRDEAVAPDSYLPEEEESDEDEEDENDEFVEEVLEGDKRAKGDDGKGKERGERESGGEDEEVEEEEDEVDESEEEDDDYDDTPVHGEIKKDNKKPAPDLEDEGKFFSR